MIIQTTLSLLLNKLEGQINILKQSQGQNELMERILFLETEFENKKLENQKQANDITDLTNMLKESQEETDNLRNELSTISENQSSNLILFSFRVIFNILGDVQRVSIESIKKSQMERDYNKIKGQKIKLEAELQQSKIKIEELEKIKLDRDQIQVKLQNIYDQKNDLHTEIFKVKEEKLKIQSEFNETESNLKSVTRESRDLKRQIEDLNDRISQYESDDAKAPVKSTFDKDISRKLEDLKDKNEELNQENVKLKTEGDQLKEKLIEVEHQVEIKLQKQREESEYLLNTYKKQNRSSKVSYENEQRLLASVITNLGYEAFKRFNTPVLEETIDTM